LRREEEPRIFIMIDKGIRIKKAPALGMSGLRVAETAI
jgi:hypothetical protein